MIEFATKPRRSFTFISLALLLAACGSRPSDAVTAGAMDGMAASAPMDLMGGAEKLAAPEAAALAVEPYAARAQSMPASHWCMPARATRCGSTSTQQP